jgi:hypothetical protein
MTLVADWVPRVRRACIGFLRRTCGPARRRDTRARRLRRLPEGTGEPSLRTMRSWFGRRQVGHIHDTGVADLVFPRDKVVLTVN